MGIFDFLKPKPKPPEPGPTSPIPEPYTSPIIPPPTTTTITPKTSTYIGPSPTYISEVVERPEGWEPYKRTIWQSLGGAFSAVGYDIKQLATGKPISTWKDPTEAFKHTGPYKAKKVAYFEQQSRRLLPYKS